MENGTTLNYVEPSSSVSIWGRIIALITYLLVVVGIIFFIAALDTGFSAFIVGAIAMIPRILFLAVRANIGENYRTHLKKGDKFF